MNRRKLLITIIIVLTIAAISLIIAISTTSKHSVKKMSVDTLSNEQLISIGANYTIHKGSDLAKHYIESQYTLLPRFDFKRLSNECMDTINEQISSVSHDIVVENIGHSIIENNEYYHYKTTLSIYQMADVIKPAILFVLKDSDIQAYMDKLYETYYSDTYENNNNLYFDYSTDFSSQMSGISVMLDSHWSILISEVTDIIGEKIAIDLYLTEDIEVAVCTVTLEDGIILNISNIDNNDFVAILENIQYYYEKIFDTY